MLATGFIVGILVMWITLMAVLEFDERAMIMKAGTQDTIRVKDKTLVVMHKEDYEDLMTRRQPNGKQSETVNLLI